MANKDALTKKINELSVIATALPQGSGRAIVEKLVTKLHTTVDSALLPDGKLSPKAKGLIPKSGLNPDGLAQGDGHALVCC